MLIDVLDNVLRSLTVVEEMMELDHLPPPVLVPLQLLARELAAGAGAAQPEVVPEEAHSVLLVETILQVCVVGCYLFSLELYLQLFILTSIVRLYPC